MGAEPKPERQADVGVAGNRRSPDPMGPFTALPTSLTRVPDPPAIPGGQDYGPVGAPGLTPQSCRLTLVTFVPYMTHGPTTRDCSFADLELAALEDLWLWDYSDALKARLRKRLPHRSARIVSSDHGLPPLIESSGELPHGLAVLDIWSFGAGLATFVDHVTVTDTMTWEMLRKTVTSETTKQRSLERTTLLVATASDPLAPDHAGQELLAVKKVEPLWAQQMLVVEARQPVDAQTLEDVASTLTPDGEQLKISTDRGSACLWLGVQACVVTNQGATELRDALARVVATQTVIWAAAIDFHVRLGTMLEKDPRQLSLKELEDRSMDLLVVFERVQQFRAEIEMIPLHLDVADKTVWDRVNEVWRLNDQLSSLDTSLNAVEHVYAHSANMLTARQGRFLNGVVLAVTMLSLATFGLTVWDFTQKGFDPFDRISLVVVLVAVVSSALLFFIVWRKSSGTGLPRWSRSVRTSSASG